MNDPRSNAVGSISPYLAGFLALTALASACSHSPDRGAAPSARQPASTSPATDTTGAPFQVVLNSPHAVQLLNDGLADLYKRLDMIAQAKDEIVYESYLIQPDIVGRIILQALAKRAQAGVKVYLLTDFYNDFGHPFFDKPELGALISQGIQVRYYNPGRLLFHPKRINFRDHRKLLVVDGRELIIGGRNTADPYFGLDPKYNYQDRDIWVKGEVAGVARDSFFAYWNDPEWVKQPSHDKNPKRFRKAEQALLSTDAKLTATLATVQQFGGETLNRETLYSDVPTVAFFTDHPDHLKDPKTIKIARQAFEPTPDRVITPFIHRALDSVNGQLVVENYTVAMSRNKEARFDEDILHHAAITILTNGFMTTDDPLSTELSHLIETELVRAAWEEKNLQAFDVTGKPPLPLLHLFGPEYAAAKWATHAKTAVIRTTPSPNDAGDPAHQTAMALIGSYNYDMRSELINNEDLLVVYDARVADDVAHDIRARIAFARPLLPTGRYPDNDPPMEEALKPFQRIGVDIMADIFENEKVEKDLSNPDDHRELVNENTRKKLARKESLWSTIMADLFRLF